MVVEDDADLAADLVNALEHIGYEVTGAVSSAEACRASAESNCPELVLMDINISGDVDGVEAAQMLRERFDIPVVFLSGHADHKTITRATLAGALGYLTKPFRLKELESAIEVALFRHRLERQLRHRERWLATTLGALRDAALAVDGEGRVAFMNAAAEDLLDEREAAVRGRALGSTFRLINESTRDPVSDPLQEALATGERIRLPRNTALITGARELPVDYSVAPIVDGSGQTAGAVAVIKDLTEERRAQQQVAMSDRLACFGVVAAGIAHEINNPLTYVLGNAEFLIEELTRLRSLLESKTSESISEALDTAAAMADLVNDIREGAGYVARIVGDLTFFARRDTGAKDCDVIDRMEWAIRVSHSAISRHARIKRQFQSVPKARIEETRLGQIFLNLLLNAAHAMQATDSATNELTVTIDLDGYNADRDAEYIRVKIQDTGCGMTEDVLKRIFDPFFTTKPPGVGTGIGLAVCHSMISEVGGDIRAASRPGEGSCFVVRLPVVAAESPRDARRPTLTGLQARVLIIDDEPLVLAVLQRMLSGVHDVVTVERAALALDLLARDPSFDVIICDLLMPEMSGLEFYEEVAKRSAEVASRVIFLSGGASAELAGKFVATAQVVALQKPPSMGELLLAIERQLEASGRGTLTPHAV